MNSAHSPSPILMAGNGTMTSVVQAHLRDRGWIIEESSDPAVGTMRLSGIVFDPGLLDNGRHAGPEGVVEALESVVESSLPRLLNTEDGGARIVVLGSRDALGSPGHASDAGVSGALISAVRSLALQLGRRGLTVNMVVGMPDPTGRAGVLEPSAAVMEMKPQALLPWPVSAADVAAAVEFFLDPRSSYVTGQVMYCCGGANLLSSLSA